MTNRIYIHLVLIAGSLGCASFAAADVFMCDQAARFGFSDSLCEKPVKGLDDLREQLKVHAPATSMAQDDRSDAWTSAFGPTKTHWQHEWSNWNSWEHSHGWNALSHVYPFTGHFDHDWFHLRLPHVHRRGVAPGPQPGSRPKHPPH